MGKFKEDKHLDPNNKARWGFTIDKDGQVKVGTKTVEETGGVQTVRTKAEPKDAPRNGGGTKE